jgi:hypothetical protein
MDDFFAAAHLHIRPFGFGIVTDQLDRDSKVAKVQTKLTQCQREGALWYTNKNNNDEVDKHWSIREVSERKISPTTSRFCARFSMVRYNCSEIINGEIALGSIGL